MASAYASQINPVRMMKVVSKNYSLLNEYNLLVSLMGSKQFCGLQ